MWKIIFLVSLLLRFIWDLTLTLLSNKQVGKPLPKSVQGIYNDEEYNKWRRYKSKQDKLGLAKRFREIQRGLDMIISEAHAIEDDSIRGATIRDITQHTMKIIEVAGHLND